MNQEINKAFSEVKTRWMQILMRELTEKVLLYSS